MCWEIYNVKFAWKSALLPELLMKTIEGAILYGEMPDNSDSSIVFREEER